MDREQAHGVASLLLRDRLELARAGRLLLRDEADEALDVGAAQLLVRPRETRELAHVRVAAAAVPLREHREVVVVVGDDALAEQLEREPRRSRRRAGRSAGGTRAAGARRARRAAAAATSRCRRRSAACSRRDGSARARRSTRRRTATRAPSGTPRRRSGCAAAAGTRAGRRPAAGRSSCGPVDRYVRSPCLRSSSSYHSASVPAAKSRTISPGSASPLSTSSLTRFAMCCASARRQWTSVPEYDDLSVTSSSTGEPNTGIGELARRVERLELVAELAGEELVHDGEHLGPRAVVLPSAAGRCGAAARRSRNTCTSAWRKP